MKFDEGDRVFARRGGAWETATYREFVSKDLGRTANGGIQVMPMHLVEFESDGAIVEIMALDVKPREAS